MPYLILAVVALIGFVIVLRVGSIADRIPPNRTNRR